MKIHTPIFILGLLTFITPFTGFPAGLESVIIAGYGLAIMILVSTIKKRKEEYNEIINGPLEHSPEEEGENTEESELEDKKEPTYEEITEEVQTELAEDVTEEENDKRSD